MLSRKTLALVCTLLGLTLAIAGPFLPGGVHLTLNDPPRGGHVTELIATPQGDVLAGTQNGEVWRLRDGLWTRNHPDLGGQPVIAMLGEPGRAPLGTAARLYFAPAGAPPLEERVGCLLSSDLGLLVGTASGVRWLVDGSWRRLEPKVNVYRLHRQQRGAEGWLHAGTIGAGVLSAPETDPGAPWRPNNLGLPSDLKVFGFVTTRGGHLVAGTDQGVFWQARPWQTWRSLHPSLDARRILSLLLTPQGDSERLWIGGDDGLQWLTLSQRGEDLSAETAPRWADRAENQPPFGIARLLSEGDRLFIAAGAVYEYGPTPLRGWYWISLAGVVLILIAGWLMPRPEVARTGG